MKSLSRLLTPDQIVTLTDATKNDCLRTLVGSLARKCELGPEDEETVYQAILDREELFSTGFGLGLALPHAKLRIIRDFTVALGIHHGGVAFDALDDRPVHILVMILGPDQRQDEYLKVLSRVVSFLKDNRELILTHSSADDIYQLTLEY